MATRFSVCTPTHNLRHIEETWRSLKAQTFEDWEWVVAVNHETGDDNVIHAMISIIVEMCDDLRVRAIPDLSPGIGVGLHKHEAFMAGTGDILVELDHDDLLAEGALETLDKTFRRFPDVGFVYSDGADFEHGKDDQGSVTYRFPGGRESWDANGWKFYDRAVNGMSYECMRAFQPSAIAMSHIFWAPNHVRAWKREVYRRVGGHNRALEICDDHELVMRTYLDTKVAHVPVPLYLYRVDGGNTWLNRTGSILETTLRLQDEYSERLVLRECELLGMPAYDLGCGRSPRAGWTGVDRLPGAAVYADLTKRWPWPDNSVGAFRASDCIEHLPDKQHTMSEMWRCLRPGGWAMTLTPSTDGRGAFQDPTHVSYWNENAFWYWTRREQASFIGNEEIRFQEVALKTIFPSAWHEANKMSYVQANLIALKGDYEGPGIIRI